MRIYSDPVDAALPALAHPYQSSTIMGGHLRLGREASWAIHEVWGGAGLYYFHARYYAPSTGRWLSNDPIGISGGLNQYTFCANNPVMFVNPDGLRWFGSGDDGWTVGREDTIISDRKGGFGRVLEEHFPAMETMSKIHAPLVGYLKRIGFPDSSVNIQTMPLCYNLAMMLEIWNSISSALCHVSD